MTDTGDVLATAERLWEGGGPGADPVTSLGSGMAEVADGVAFVPSFANVAAVATGDGLVLVDVGSQFLSGAVHRTLRGWTDRDVHTAVYSHGHIDHVFGMHRWEADAEAHGRPRPRVVAHEAVSARFDRYIRTAGYNTVVNRRQFGIDDLTWPTEYRYPDRTFRDRLDLEVGGVRAELHHDRGETDDHAWAWFPDLRVLCTGDLFIWTSPNAGNPQKVQRYPLEWATALRRMLALYDLADGGPEVLLPGHGYPIMGGARIRQALSETAELLESLVAQTLEYMNGGARLDEAIHSVEPPAHLMARPYLQPVYDEPEFVVRSVWRLYGGWWDGNPATLQPAPERALARELADLSGGPGALADRALALLARAPTPGGDGGDEGALRLAGHLVELAWLAAPDDPAVSEARRTVFTRRAGAATSTMARGVFTWAARESGPGSDPAGAARPRPGPGQAPAGTGSPPL
ncbi:MAG TPA: alkyl sulfatase dimerization domain-containing protein [Acidimicrobiales bacterium]|nr:alkyl sulfatase dimerization domain-containing protein [Acidimicrobiales bacterium]